MVADFSKRLRWQIRRNFVGAIKVCKFGILIGVKLADDFSSQLAPADAMARIAHAVKYVLIRAPHANGGMEI